MYYLHTNPSFFSSSADSSFSETLIDKCDLNHTLSVLETVSLGEDIGYRKRKPMLFLISWRSGWSKNFRNILEKLWQEIKLQTWHTTSCTTAYQIDCGFCILGSFTKPLRFVCAVRFVLIWSEPPCCCFLIYSGWRTCGVRTPATATTAWTDPPVHSSFIWVR